MTPNTVMAFKLVVLVGKKFELGVLFGRTSYGSLHMH